MWILNLAKPETSDIEFEVSKFPDGQQDIILKGFTKVSNLWPNDLSGSLVGIRSRFNSFKDLELIICATHALQRLGVARIDLYIPYLLGSRSDRVFVEGGTSYLVDVIAPILNAQNYGFVTVLDAHSDVAAACIKNLVSQSSATIFKNFVFDIEGFHKWEDKVVLVSPDAGALKKVYKVAKAMTFEGRIITCTKDRDEKGALSKVVVPLHSNEFFQDKKYIILDDICDGGRTFINIAKELRPIIGKKATIHLIVSHGIFSAGISELSTHIDSIHCTNSVSDLLVDKYGNSTTNLIKQINVF